MAPKGAVAPDEAAAGGPAVAGPKRKEATEVFGDSDDDKDSENTREEQEEANAQVNKRRRGSALESDLAGLRGELLGDGSRGRKAEEDKRAPSRRRERSDQHRRVKLVGRRKEEPALESRSKSPRREPIKRLCPFGSAYMEKPRRGRSSRRWEEHRDGGDDGRQRTVRSRSRSSSTSSSASAVFRDASSSTGKPSRRKLVKFAERHPGRLAERLLNRMYRKVMVEGEAEQVQPCALPIVAKAYHLRVTKTQHPDASIRNMTEGNIIAHVLDHLAAKRFGQAADILSQRYTALEATMSGIPWERARFLELVDEEDNTLVGQHERVLVANESAAEAKLESRRLSYGGGWKGSAEGSQRQGASKSSKGWGKSSPFLIRRPDRIGKRRTGRFRVGAAAKLTARARKAEKAKARTRASTRRRASSTRRM